jgi:hypothetical protein
MWQGFSVLCVILEDRAKLRVKDKGERSLYSDYKT